MAVSRTFGLSGSGIDVDSMVKQLMTAKRLQYANLYQSRDLLTWKKQAYNDIYNQATSFRKTLTSYELSSALSIKTVSSTNTAAATATATADAVNVSHSLNVTQLATGVTMTSTGSITASGNQKDTLADQFGLAAGKFNLKITNGSSTATIAVDPAGSINDFITQVNQSNTNVTANYDATLDRVFFYTTNTGASAGISFAGSDAAGSSFVANNLKLSTVSQVLPTTSAAVAVDPTQTLASLFGTTGSFNISIAGAAAPVTINATDTLNTVMSNINAAAGGNANLTYDAVAKKFTLNATSGTLDLTGSDQAAFDFLSGDLGLNVNSGKGTDSQFTLDGVNLSEATNAFQISGVSYNLAGLGSATLNVANDTSKIATSIQSFVDQYNKLLDATNAKLAEHQDRNYPPLTADQKSSMTATDITNWQIKAQTGLLENDDMLGGMVDSMRNAVAAPITGLTGIYNSAASIGITSGDYTENGHLYLDTTKLTAALNADPNAVLKIFGTSGNASDSQNGISFRLANVIDNTNKMITAEAGVDALVDDQSNLSLEINDYSATIKTTETNLSNDQDQYYNEFTQMETYIQKMNSQSSWLSQQFGGSSSSSSG